MGTLPVWTKSAAQGQWAELHISDVDGYCWTAKEGKESCDTINGLSNNESEVLGLLFFMNRIFSSTSLLEDLHAVWSCGVGYSLVSHRCISGVLQEPAPGNRDTDGVIRTHINQHPSV